MFATVLKAPKKPSDVIPITANAQTCTGCRWRIDGITCDAFPEGIPTAILVGAFDHTHHYKRDDGDDQGVTYQPEPL